MATSPAPAASTDWIIKDPEIDFAALFERFDTFLMGRRTLETASTMFNMPGKEIFVFSRTLREENYPDVTINS
jgi:dihydrofolate reductase